MHKDALSFTNDLTTLPNSVLFAELARRQSEPDTNSDRPACGSASSSRAYNTSLHVFALFLILILSTLACSFPIIVRRFPKLPVPNYTLFLSRHFGTGVLIATAFVHLLPTAYVSLTDPCLPRFWNEVYPAMSGFIAMCSVFAVVGIEMFFALKGAAHSHGGLDLERLRGEAGDDTRRPEDTRRESLRLFRHGPVGYARVGDEAGMGEEGMLLEAEQSTPISASLDKPLPPEPPFEDDDEDDDLAVYELDPMVAHTQPLNGATYKSGAANGHVQRPGHTSRPISFAAPHTTNSNSEPPNEQRAVLQCLLLEAGILFHSIFIGMALSVSTGPAFLVLLIAVSFHQIFEGLALGSRIAAIGSFSTTSFRPWLMSAMYGVTTPIGQAIGLAVHTLYDPASQFGLLMVGIVNAVSAGLLLYAGLVQLLAEDFLSDASYSVLKGRRRLEACGAVVCGSMLMAFVGAFA